MKCFSKYDNKCSANEPVVGAKLSKIVVERSWHQGAEITRFRVANRTGDRRTFMIIREIGDSLENMIGYPSSHVNGRVPILGMAVWAEKDDRGVGQPDSGFL